MLESSRRPPAHTASVVAVAAARGAEHLLTRDPHRRIHLMQTGLALLLTAYCAVLALYVAHLAGTPMPLAYTWATCTMVGIAAVFVSIRAGWTQGLADPSLTTLQLSFTVTSAAILYALIGPLRAATFPALVITLVFGMFTLAPRVLMGIAAYTLALFGAVMLFKSQQDPAVYPPSVELAYFLVLAALVPMVPVLTARHAGISNRYQQQQNDMARVREQASRDELTGLMNRRQMTLILQRAQTRRTRSGRPYCLAVLDLDFFKRVNDQHGHAAGDEVLRHFAEVAMAVVRDKDTVCRWGGEEFVILLNDTKLEAAKVGVERIREQVAASKVRVGADHLSITLSAGIAEPLDGESFERALSRADDALYVAKARGRNQVVTA